MSIRLLFIAILCLFLIKINKNLITVVDKKASKSIPYVTISFGNNDGIYTDQNGRFDLSLITSDSIRLSSLGYQSKIIAINTIQRDTIFLNPTDIQLNEVLVSNKKQKFKTKKIKSINDRDFLNSYRNPIGCEIACLIKNDFSKNDVQLKSITIPSYNKTMDFNGANKQVLKRHAFSTLYKVNFYFNLDGKPGERITSDTLTIQFNEKTDKLKINLESHQIYLPKNGLFISLLNLGPANAEGKLIPTSPYYEQETKKGKLKFVKHIKPYFPVNYYKNENFTYMRIAFDNDLAWKVFNLNNSNQDKFNNISLGYELKVFN
ncbi:carboxypeptidase-like regulatory domain-containing protein [Winogradskyella sp. DF17]|uniref:Carboxypeptidase-like regulatory domain-containing protein n=1 Tax=Winogradskyella pelagia TaxID=2819984 RepID=A0ABS3T1Q5_9FLAO|nr:carboxypeptidase-like regulatory domain-containing protein [Winogradskyella sp. DF17]MBO3116672.1 carboxypeptidase-like regulatory domain-containing protein [Winogradskyella sp. DF17]